MSYDCVRSIMGACNRLNLDDFVVLCHASYDLQLQVKESILLSKHKPVLNNNVCSLPTAPCLVDVMLLFCPFCCRFLVVLFRIGFWCVGTSIRRMLPSA